MNIAMLLDLVADTFGSRAALTEDGTVRPTPPSPFGCRPSPYAAKWRDSTTLPWWPRPPSSSS
jgi:hypothetical protein